MPPPITQPINREFFLNQEIIDTIKITKKGK